MFFLVSSRSRNTLISLLRASTTGAGALFGRKMPNQDETSNLANSGPGLAHGRNVRRRCASFRRGHRERIELAVLYLRQRRKQVVRQNLDIARQRRLQRRARATERHM